MNWNDDGNLDINFIGISTGFGYNGTFEFPNTLSGGEEGVIHLIISCFIFYLCQT